MQTPILTHKEEEHVERMAESFSEPTMSERFEEWAARSISHSDKEKKEYEWKHRPRETSLKDKSDEEREFIDKVGQREESEKDSSAKSSTEKDAAAKRSEQRQNANEKPEAKADEKSAASEPNNSPSEPLSGERHWEAKFEGKENDDFQRRVNSRVEVALDYIDKHADKPKIQEGMRGFFQRQDPAHAQAFLSDFAKALAEVPNPGEVIRHIGLHAQDREVLRNAASWKEVRAAVRTISKHYATAAPDKKVTEIRPRAPKPPTELPARSAAGDDGTRGETSFSSFSTRQSQHYAHAR